MRVAGDQSKSYLSALERLAKNGLNSFAYEKLELTGGVDTLTPPADAKYAIVVVESTELTGMVARMLSNKSVPVSATIGMPLINFSVVEVIDAKNITEVQFFLVAGTTAVNVEYFR